MKSEGPISRAYEYYDGDVEGYDQGGDVVVTAGDGIAPFFIRGDANVDGTVNLSDAVATLDYLCAGITASFRCADAADANDDSKLNITDPIFVLGHLFSGGPPPAAPYPDPGHDETEDELGCRVGL